MATSPRELLRRFEVKNVEGLNISESKKKAKGEGSFGAVYEVTVDGDLRIAKRLHDILLSSDIQPSEKKGIQERFCEECHILSKLNHPNIVEFVGVHFGGGTIVNYADISLIMEHLHTDLARFLDSAEHPNIPLSIKLSNLLDVSAGLFYLHTQLKEPVIHRDLKPENILLTKDVRAKLADLGVSKLLKNYPHTSVIHTKCPGTLAYMPPEALCENPNYDTCLDIFSFGQVALYTANQQFPEVFSAIFDPKMTSAIRSGEVEILRRKKWFDMLPKGCCLKDIILKCLKDKPKERPQVQELNREMKTLCVRYPKLLKDIVSVWEDKEKVCFYHICYTLSCCYSTVQCTCS